MDVQKQQQHEYRYKRAEILLSLQLSFCTLHDSLAEKCRHSTDSLSAEAQGLEEKEVFYTLDALMQARTVSRERGIAKGQLLKLDELYKCVCEILSRKSYVASSLWPASYINFP